MSPSVATWSAVARTSAPTVAARAGDQPRLGEHAFGQAGALLLVVVGRRVVDHVVEERRRDDGVEIGDGHLARQRVHVAHHPRDVADAVVPALRFAVAPDDVVQGGQLGRPGPHGDRPRRPQLGVVTHRPSVLRDDRPPQAAPRRAARCGSGARTGRSDGPAARMTRWPC